ncbi:hypothetical protein IKG38_01615 [Candidatus Saccharibacteria bacterium]|nr:hypothetical protein [Candidatus Saccharibacteria bacterium]
MCTFGLKKGFTLVELSLSIAFIAILSIIIVIMITNTISSYRRGLTLNKINSTGMDLVDEIRATVQNSPSRSLVGLCSRYNDNSSSSSYYARCVQDGGRYFVSVVKKGNVGANVNSQVPIYGAFCTGTYSYIWNSGYYFSDEYGLSNGAVLTYSDDGDKKQIEGFKLLKVEDGSRAICASMVNESSYSLKSTNEFDVTDKLIIVDEPIDLLKGDVENDLAIYDLESAIPAESKSSQNLFYSVSFILGTVQGGINIKASGNFCATQGELENMDFCAINKFNFAVQATGA